MTKRHEVINYNGIVPEYHFFDSKAEAHKWMDERIYSATVYHYRDWHPSIEEESRIIWHHRCQNAIDID